MPTDTNLRLTFHSFFLSNVPLKGQLIANESLKSADGCLALLIIDPPTINPLTAGAAYIRDFNFISTLSTTFIMLKIKCDINQQDLKRVNHLSNLNNFHSLEVVDRVSETQLQVGKNSN